MSFLRHGRSIGPMGRKSKSKAKPSKPEGECRLPLVGTRASVKDATEGARLGLIVRDESHRVSLGRLLSSRARLRFPGCSQFAMKVSGRSRNFQRPASSVLTVCLSSGGHRTEDTSNTLRFPTSATVGLKMAIFKPLPKALRYLIPS